MLPCFMQEVTQNPVSNSGLTCWLDDERVEITWASQISVDWPFPHLKRVVAKQGYWRGLSLSLSSQLSAPSRYEKNAFQLRIVVPQELYIVTQADSSCMIWSHQKTMWFYAILHESSTNFIPQPSEVGAKMNHLKILPKVGTFSSAYDWHAWRVRGMLTELYFGSRTNQLDEFRCDALFDPLLKDLRTMKRVFSMEIGKYQSTQALWHTQSQVKAQDNGKPLLVWSFGSAVPGLESSLV
ncbi:uncharacterized protein EV420DRAFT_1473280 [Desarmillaria tabescens]|uniref:Uncharacterized protein n=1 Tax=Armillaria tabescens TaxID=1929756 RepID=A0AA39NRJ1_ARMTA|nr:uncharacterized protein EV420DRAFT_1473280 [Desarmillaria tabescens]KAK0470198.1 hypothetical protein EV420DRAFT_1473280 [Desarmillaria tabescens]